MSMHLLRDYDSKTWSSIKTRVPRNENSKALAVVIMRHLIRYGVSLWLRHTFEVRVIKAVKAGDQQTGKRYNDKGCILGSSDIQTVIDSKMK